MTLLLILSLVPPPAALDTRPILDAIRVVETGAESDPDHAIGDGGDALGAYQIHRSYWLDATEKDPALRALGYESVTDRSVAERVVIAYLTRYAPRWDLDTVSRIHNGGPKGHTKNSTKGYAAKVAKAAKEARQ
jgi:hypothetical protein